MKKVSDLAGHELDAWVLMAQHPSQRKRSDGWPENYVKRFQYHPSTDWNIGGMIIERERITIFEKGERWAASMVISPSTRLCDVRGDTHLEAAMRCYVASVYGETVDV